MKKKLGLAAIFFLLTGCAAQFRSPAIDAEGRLSLPWSAQETQLQVVFPASSDNLSGGGKGSDSLTRMYGPDWRDLQDEYDEYRFNGER